MKNLFDYATKELSQDAFLRWLFENGFDEQCKSSELKKIARELFDSLTDNEFKNKEIKELKTEAQWKKIDVSVWFKVDGVENLIVIEDKTGSKEHNQLANYNKEISKHNDSWSKKPENAKRYNIRYIEQGKIFKIFYKTYTIYEEERERVKESNWKIFGIEDISRIFCKHERTSLQVLDDYIEHIKRIKQATENREKPADHITILDCVKWEAYYNNVVIPRLKEKIDTDLKLSVFKTMYSYVCLCIEKEEGAPYLEIRSRDCGNGELCARILCYGIYTEDKEAKIQKVKDLFEEIKKHELFSQKNCKKNAQEKKQLGFVTYENIYDEEEFLNKIVESILEYLKVMDKWGK